MRQSVDTTASGGATLKKLLLRAILAGVFSGVLLSPLLLSLHREVNLFKAYSILVPLGVVYVLVLYFYRRKG
ncbi:hypothetical protein [Pontibacter rugosus]|uniref:Uncharacterized protein n=1 Tax=Pontibacter rugosus TaxID=1745966 RepID=A0ABW3SN50_9BACT